MPINKYDSNHKAAVMILLERSGGNVPLIAQQTGIPQRTLYNWQRHILPHLQQYNSFLPNPAEDMAFDDDLSALSHIRKQIIGEIVRLSNSLRNDASISTPYQRVLVISRLVDKLMKLDLHLKPYKPQEPMTIRVIRVEKPLNDGKPHVETQTIHPEFSDEDGDDWYANE